MFQQLTGLRRTLNASLLHSFVKSLFIWWRDTLHFRDGTLCSQQGQSFVGLAAADAAPVILKCYVRKVNSIMCASTKRMVGHLVCNLV